MNNYSYLKDFIERCYTNKDTGVLEIPYKLYKEYHVKYGANFFEGFEKIKVIDSKKIYCDINIKPA